MVSALHFWQEDFDQIGGPKRVVVNFSPCVVEHSPATKHLARQKVLRDEFVHRGREVDLRGRAGAATKRGTLQVRLLEKTSS